MFKRWSVFTKAYLGAKHLFIRYTGDKWIYTWQLSGTCVRVPAHDYYRESLQADAPKDHHG